MGLFEQFCERFAAGFTHKEGDWRQIGVEKEILVVDQQNEMAMLTDKLWPHLKAQNLKAKYDTFYKDEVTGFDLDGEEITTDAGRGTFELILKPYETVQECDAVMKRLLSRLLPLCEQEELSVLGLGYQPLTEPARENWNRKQRYDILDSLWEDKVRTSTLSAADQAHIDISLDELVPVVNSLSALAGFLMVLFSNSPIGSGEVMPRQINREMIWDDLGLDRTGVPARPWESVEDYLNAIWQVDCIMAKDENGKFSAPRMPFIDFTEGKDLNQVIKDFEIHEACIWFCARPRIFGTVEIRPICTQPWEDMTVAPAMILGLVENWKEVQEFLKPFDWKRLRQLRHDASKEGFGIVLQGRAIADWIRELIEIAERGLKARGKGEEGFLQCLYERVERQQSPADVAIEYFEKGGVDLLVEKTSLRPEHLVG